ncbi:hypothetical protein PsorP6_014581 [Peronosclerospora sorghi]|uniref:Uncharacterized protein n=1 Tax=Peronosclerospora sorghi TaxID=230839 RepID=A0ACC0VTM9_9STRA|nr:hypothetical protein PsorP6_014581 [Peronosclerospora sorghi]
MRTGGKKIPALEPEMQWGQGVDGTFSTLVTHLQTLMAKGLTSFMLSGVVNDKDERGSMADDESTPIIKFTAALRKALPELLVACDVCMCEYKDHGYCGILRVVDGDHVVDNGRTLKRLINISLTCARPELIWFVHPT